MALIKDNIEHLTESDIWSFILFTVFKMRDIPEYTSLSELVYILDKDTLLKLCEYFGGQTLTIPTIEELESMLYGLLLYQFVEVEDLSFEEALSKLPGSVQLNKRIKQNYLKIRSALSSYEFSSRGN